VSVLVILLAAGSAAWFVLRCTVLAPATGRHSLTPHRGWEGRTDELHALQVGRHTQRIKTCGDRNPDELRATCTLPLHHGGSRHEQRLAGVLLREWAPSPHPAGVPQ